MSGEKAWEPGVIEAVPLVGAPPGVGWWWLSFSSGEFLGGCCVEGGTVGAALERAVDVGCNPGGEVMAFHLGAADLERIPVELRGRLLSKDDMIGAGLGATSVEVEANDVA